MGRIIFFLLALIIASLSADAISVVSDYLANDTLELISGNSKIYSIRLQNSAENEVSIKLDYNTDLMKVIDYKYIYTLQPKESGYRILFNITAPKKPGLYNVGYTVSEIEPSSGGGLPIRLKINKNFNLKVIEKPNEFSTNNLNLVNIAILLIITLFILKLTLKKKKRKVNK